MRHENAPRPGDRRVRADVLRRIWDSRPLYNGLTNVELVRIYGTRVYHVPGDTWYIEPK
jgi:hypothetical protein